MNFFIKERKFEDETSRTAFSKAREDAERIWADMGFHEISVWPELGDRTHAGRLEKLHKHFLMAGIWKRRLAALGDGDVLFLQLPVVNNCLFLAGILKKAKRRGVTVVALLHDLETLRMGIDENIKLGSKLRMRVEESGVLRLCDRLIAHNESMISVLESHGIARNKLIPLGVFDYLVDEDAAQAIVRHPASDDRRTLIVAGNLSPQKAGYVYQVPDGIPMNLYGVCYQDTGREGRHYRGSFRPGELPGKLEGGFGLVWDGESADTCAGVYGEYLRYNNPHKLSLYLASGFPVVIWKEAALAGFVTGERAGLTAGSIPEAAEMIASMGAEEYAALRENAGRIGQRLRSGAYLRAATAAACGE